MKYKVSWWERVQVVIPDPWWRRWLRKVLPLKDRKTFADWRQRTFIVDTKPADIVSLSLNGITAYVDDVTIKEQGEEL